MEHFWRLGWPGFRNFGPNTFPHLKGVHINHHIWKERGNMIHFGLPIEGILERTNHPFHEIVKRIQPYSPVTTHLVGDPPKRASSKDTTDRKSDYRQSVDQRKSEKNYLSSPGSLINQQPPVEGSLAGTIAKITAEAVSGAEAHPTEDPMFPSPYDNSPAGPPTDEELKSASHHHFTHNRLYHNQRQSSLYSPNEMFQGEIKFKPLGIYSGGKFTWDPLIFDRHFETTFNVGKLNEPIHIHSSESQAHADDVMSQIKDNLITGSSSLIPSKIHAKHVPDHFSEMITSDSTEDTDPGNAPNPLFSINPWNDVMDTSVPASSQHKSVSVIEDNHNVDNDELSFLDELSFIIANEPHVRK